MAREQLAAAMVDDAMIASRSPEDHPSRAAPQPWWARVVEAAAGLFAFAIVVTVLIQVIGRLKGTPVPWSEELTRACFLWMIFLGLASTMRSADAARVTVLLDALPILRRIALPVYMAACLGFFALMAWAGFAVVRQQFVMNESIATLGWPSWMIGAVMPLSAVLAAVGTIASLKDHRDAIAAKKPHSPEAAT